MVLLVMNVICFSEIINLYNKNIVPNQSLDIVDMAAMGEIAEFAKIEILKDQCDVSVFRCSTIFKMCR